MFDLEAGIELEEKVRVSSRIVQQFDRAGANVPNRMCQALSGTLHLLESVGLGKGGRAFFKKHLQATLGGRIATIELYGITVFVADILHFFMPRVLSQLHYENGRPDDVVLNLNESLAQILFVVDKPDAFAATTFASLDHETAFIANLFGGRHGFFDRSGCGLVENVVGDYALVVQVGLQRAVIFPAERATLGKGRHIGGNLVSEHAHDGRREPDKVDDAGRA
jgi:hypothetical protein